ncbi:MAG TPA: MFS transporter [Bacillaceae bacterium]
MLPLSLFNFVYYWGISLTVAFLPLLFRYKGMSSGEIGLLLSVGPFVAIFAQPLWGVISDRRQTVKKMILLLLAASLIVSTGVFLGGTFSFLFIAMGLFHFFMSPIQPLTDSLATTYAAENNVNYGSIRLWGSLGFSVAAFVIGLVVGQIGIGKIGFVYAGIMILSIAISFLLADSSGKKTPVSLDAIKGTLKNPYYTLFLGAALLLSIPHRMNDSLLGLYMSELGASEGQIGAAWTLAALSEAVVIGVMFILMKRFHLLKLIMFAGLLYSLRWMLYSFASEPGILVLLQAMHSLTFAIFIVASVQYVATVVPTEMLATGQAVFFAIFSGVAGIIGSSAGGYFMDAMGASFVYRAGSASALAGTLVCAMLLGLAKKKKNHRKKIQTSSMQQ